jgi:HEAT repeat protein
MAQRLAQHLMARGLVSARLVDEAIKHAENAKVGLDTSLLALSAISEAGMLQAISDVSNTRLVNLADFEPNIEAGPMMPYKLSKQLGVVPLSLDGQTLHIACAYPVPTSQLKDVGFLLGRKLELWVALEARVRDWQSAIYGQPLDNTVAKVLKQLDPSRPTPNQKQDSSNALEVVEHSFESVDEEPLLLTAPKKKRKPIEVVDEPSVVVSKDAVPLGESEENHTAVIDTTAYSRFARGGLDPDTQGLPPSEHDSTRVLDLRGYANFAKASAEVANPALSFPGGVLPPRSTSSLSPPNSMPPVSPGWVQAASPARPPPEKVVPLESPRSRPEPVRPPKPAADKPVVFTDITLEARPTPPEPAPLGASVAGNEGTSAVRDEADFSDINDLISAAPVPSPQVPPEPPPTLRGPSQPPFTEELPPPPQASAPRPGVVPLIAPFSQFEPNLANASLPEVPAQESWVVPPAGAPPTWTLPVPGMASTQVVYPAPPGLAPSSATEWTLAQARQSVKETTTNREALISVVLEYGRRAFDFVAAFAVVRGSAVGWDSRGGEAEAVRQMAVPLDAASVFRTVALTRGSYVGPLPPDALTKHYLALMGRTPRTVFLWPVEVQSRLVAMLYGDCGPKPVSQRRLADFILFCQDLSTTFHDLILFRKQNPKAPQEFAIPTPLPAAAPETPHSDSSEGEPHRSDLPVDAEWFNGLIALLTGPDPSERSMAMLELMKTPKASASALAHAFPGPTGWSRLPVVELPESDELGPVPSALARLGHPAAIALAPLLDSSDSEARYLALLTAGSLRYPEVIDGVMRGLFDLEPDISSAARAAATSLRFLPTFQTRLHELRQELASTDPLRRSLAARALGVLHDRDAIDGLINLTASEDELVATSAAEALKEITRSNFGPTPRAWTAWYARARSQRRVEWLVDALASDDFDLRLSAIEELSRTFGDNYGFLADGPPADRKTSLEQWKYVISSRPNFDL